MLKKKDILLLAEVKKGRQRRLVLQNIESENPQLVSEIQRTVNRNLKEGKPIRLSDVSRALSKLRELGLVKCLNPASKRGEKGILYQLTPEGRKIQKLLQP